MKSFKKTALATMIIMMGIGSVSIAAPYKVKKEDSFWLIGREHGVSLESILEENNVNEKTRIHPGQIIQIAERRKVSAASRGSISSVRGTIIDKEGPQKNDDSKEETDNGEYLDWFEEVDKLFPIGSEFKAINFYTGKSFLL